MRRSLDSDLSDKTVLASFYHPRESWKDLKDARVGARGTRSMLWDARASH